MSVFPPRLYTGECSECGRVRCICSPLPEFRPSGRKPDAGASAEPRHSKEQYTNTPNRPAGRPVGRPQGQRELDATTAELIVWIAIFVVGVAIIAAVKLI